MKVPKSRNAERLPGDLEQVLRKSRDQKLPGVIHHGCEYLINVCIFLKAADFHPRQDTPQRTVMRLLYSHGGGVGGDGR